MYELSGTSIIGFSRAGATGDTFTGFDPTTGDPVEPNFFSASLTDLETAVGLAEMARIPYGSLAGRDRARFLRAIADNIESLGDTLLQRATLETSLPDARFVGERARTCGQLRMFADVLDEGSWVDAHVDHAIPARQPVPKPDVRSMLKPVGPVAVFCASNFPFAYSVAGGDTASALAAGCPVIVIAHTAHPGTAEYVGHAILEASRSCGMPEGVFSLLFAKGHDIGQALVKHPVVKAVGFTGSRKGGRALMDIAAARPEPIAVYTEMSSVNPTFILPGAAAARHEELAAGLHASVTTGAGQFCTKPGLVFTNAGIGSQAMINKFRDLIKATPPSPLLTGGMEVAYEAAVKEREAAGILTTSNPAADGPGYSVFPAVFQISSEDFLADPNLSEEVFGPATVIVYSGDVDHMVEIARSLEGQLTASIHGIDEDLAEYAGLIAVLETKVGRIIYNGFSTGVEVCPSMVHGGPYPATSDGRSTAVGSRAITRFSRLVCYQNFPDEALPDELKDANPLAIWRMVDGEFDR